MLKFWVKIPFKIKVFLLNIVLRPVMVFFEFRKFNKLIVQTRHKLVDLLVFIPVYFHLRFYELAKLFVRLNTLGDLKVGADLIRLSDLFVRRIKQILLIIGQIVSTYLHQILGFEPFKFVLFLGDLFQSFLDFWAHFQEIFRLN